MKADGTNRNAYSLLLFKHILKRYDSSGGSPSISADITYYATIADSSITFPILTYAAHNTYLDLVLNI